MIKTLRKKFLIKKALKLEKKLQKTLKKEDRNSTKNSLWEYDNAIISWEAPEFIKYKKGWLWYIVFILLMILLSVGAYMYNSITFSIAVIGFLIAYLVFDKTPPKLVNVSISEIGIKVGDKVYQFGRIRAFWIIYNPPLVRTLNIRVHNELLSDVEIQLNNISPAKIHKFLVKKIPELEGQSEGLFKNFIKIFKL